MNIKTLLVATLATVSLFIATPVAHAQGGQGGGMRGMMRGAGGMFLLRRNDVRKDLKLTDKQIADLTALQEKMQTEMREMFQNGGGGGDREALMKMVQEKMAAAQKETDAILTPEQQARLKQINVQITGNRVILDPDTQTKLKLTDAQKAKIKDLQEKQQAANQSLMEKMRNGEIEREELTASMTKNNDALNVELGKLLTDDQKKMLADMAGPKFDRDPADDRPGGGFGGGL